MNHKLLGAVIALSAIAAPAMATTIDIGDIYGRTGTSTYVSPRSFSGGTDVGDTYTFSLSQNSVVHMTLTDTARLSGLTSTLTKDGATTPLTTLGALDPYDNPTQGWQSDGKLHAGTYTINVLGSYMNHGSYSLQLSSDVAAPVPGPAGFLVAGAGALVLVARRRRTKARAALA